MKSLISHHKTFFNPLCDLLWNSRWWHLSVLSGSFLSLLIWWCTFGSYWSALTSQVHYNYLLSFFCLGFACILCCANWEYFLKKFGLFFSEKYQYSVVCLCSSAETLRSTQCWVKRWLFPHTCISVYPVIPVHPVIHTRAVSPATPAAAFWLQWL